MTRPQRRKHQGTWRTRVHKAHERGVPGPGEWESTDAPREWEVKASWDLDAWQIVTYVTAKTRADAQAQAERFARVTKLGAVSVIVWPVTY